MLLALMLDKLGGAKEIIMKIFAFHFVFHSACTNFVTIMTREELILDCRYYNGEDYPPIGVDELMWGYEEAWVRMVLENNPTPQKHIDYYTREFDLPNLLPEKEDGTPIGIKAILWNRLDHWSYYPADADNFKKWYKEKYVANTKTHRQLLNR